MNEIDDAEIKRFLRSEVDQAALVAVSDFHNVDDVMTIKDLRAEVLTLRERVAFLESPEVCAAAHDDVTDCGYCQRDRLRAQLLEHAEVCKEGPWPATSLRAEVERLTLRTQKDSVTIARLKGELKHCHAERAAPMKEA